mmetsp:Transcript_1118/g.2509  ORF Transcript_1118/g.2509 Transcript_1118/m.2509 type:complete len:106 (+) Transcript_1118:74-391(+)
MTRSSTPVSAVPRSYRVGGSVLLYDGTNVSSVASKRPGGGSFDSVSSMESGTSSTSRSRCYHNEARSYWYDGDTVKAREGSNTGAWYSALADAAIRPRAFKRPSM